MQSGVIRGLLPFTIKRRPPPAAACHLHPLSCIRISVLAKHAHKLEGPCILPLSCSLPPFGSSPKNCADMRFPPAAPGTFGSPCSPSGSLLRLLQSPGTPGSLARQWLSSVSAEVDSGTPTTLGPTSQLLLYGTMPEQLPAMRVSTPHDGCPVPQVFGDGSDLAARLAALCFV